MHSVTFIYKALLLKLPLYLNPVIMGLPYHKGLLIKVLNTPHINSDVGIEEKKYCKRRISGLSR